MEGYHRNWNWEQNLAEGAGMLLGMVLAIVITLVIIMVLELARVYSARAFQPTPTARVLWIALATVIGVAVVCGFLIADPATAPLGAYIAGYSFLLFVIVVEGADLYEKRFDTETEFDGVDVEDTFVNPWISA